MVFTFLIHLEESSTSKFIYWKDSAVSPPPPPKVLSRQISPHDFHYKGFLYSVFLRLCEKTFGGFLQSLWISILIQNFAVCVCVGGGRGGRKKKMFDSDVIESKQFINHGCKWKNPGTAQADHTREAWRGEPLMFWKVRSFFQENLPEERTDFNIFWPKMFVQRSNKCGSENSWCSNGGVTIFARKIFASQCRKK